MLLLSPIWNCRRELIDEAPRNVPAEYRWQYSVNIPRRDAERVKEILWKVANAKAKSARPGAKAGAAQLTLELAELWDVIVQEL